MKTHFMIFLLFVVSVSLAQKADTVRRGRKFIPTGIRIGTDAISIAKSQYVKTFTGWEVNADVDVHRYFLALDVGSWGRTYLPDSGRYANTGRYYRVGIDVNFLTKDLEKNAFFIGFRYGHSKFSEDFVINLHDPIWGDLAQDYKTTNVKAHWLEMTTGLKVKMWRFFWMGYTARYKFALGYHEAPMMISSDVPGFGRTDKPTTWGFNYQLFVRIPVTKRK